MRREVPAARIALRRHRRHDRRGRVHGARRSPRTRQTPTRTTTARSSTPGTRTPAARTRTTTSPCYWIGRVDDRRGRRDPGARADWSPARPPRHGRSWFLRGSGCARARLPATRSTSPAASTRSATPSTSLERYDIAKNRWTRRAPMPAALNHAAVAVYKGDLYIVGGYSDGNVEQATLYRYEPTADRWSDAAEHADAARRAHRWRHRQPPVRRRAAPRTARPSPRSRSTTSRPAAGAPARRWRTAREHLGGAVSARRSTCSPAASPDQPHRRRALRPRQERLGARCRTCARSRGGTAAATLSDGRIVIAGGEETGRHDPLGRARSIPRTPPLEPPAPACRKPRHGLGVVARGRTVYTVEGGVKPGFSFSNAIESLLVAAR